MIGNTLIRRLPWLLVVLAGGLGLLGGCGEQDLYAPPGAPFQVIARLPLPSFNEGVAVLDEHVFVAGGEAGLHIVDLTDPTHPTLVNTINTTRFAVCVEIMRTFARHNLVDVALVVEGTEGITTYDVTEPANAASFNQGTTAVDGVSLTFLQPEDPDQPAVVFLAENWKGVRVFQTDPDYPGLLQYNGVFTGTLGFAKGLAVLGGYAYVADDEMGLVVVDARELILGAVRVVSWCDSPGNALEIALEGSHAFVADGTEGLAVFAIDGGNAPQHVAQLDLSGFARAIAVRDGIAVIAAAAGGVHFVDVRTPTSPVFLGTVITGYATDIALADDGYVLVSDRVDGLMVLGGHGPFIDSTPPALVSSLVATPRTGTTVELAWYAPGDDRMVRRATAYEIRRASAPILDAAAWDGATVVPNPPLPANPGTAETFVVGGLSPLTEYHFALRAIDDAGLTSPLSNPTAATTLAGVILLDPQLDMPAGTPADLFTFAVTYVNSDGNEPVEHDVVIDGDQHVALSLVSGDYATGALFSGQVGLPKGEHTHHFTFADAAGNSAATPEANGPLVGAVVFTMGSPTAEPGRDPDEVERIVVLSDSVRAWPHEVTQSQWIAAGMANGSHFNDDLQKPVEQVTWLQAVEFCNRLSAAESRVPAYDIVGPQVTWNRDADGWRLPTEAEWEWLCRAGTTSALAGGELTETTCGVDPVLDAYGWYCGNAGAGTHTVGQKSANAFGLRDMHGNVWEWCWDWYAPYVPGPVLDPVGPEGGVRRVIRGGSWYYFARDCRSASRGFYAPSASDDIVGLRVVRTIR